MKNIKFVTIPIFFILFLLQFAQAQNPLIYAATVSSTSIKTCNSVTYTISYQFTGDGTPHTIKITDFVANRFSFNLNDITVPIGFTKVITGVPGGTLITVEGIISSTIAVTGQIVIHATAISNGTYKHCFTSNTAKIYKDGVLTHTKLFPQVLIETHNKWTITKEVVGIVSTNTYRYIITISSDACDAYNLYWATLYDAPQNGGVVIRYDGAPTSSTSWGLPTLLIGHTYVHYIDVKYPCALPSGTPVTNCAKLKGRSPAACYPYPLGPLETINQPVPCVTIPIAGYVFTQASVGPTISKSHNLDRNHAPGCEDEYTISYVNNSTAIISNLTICDLFPGNYLDFIAANATAFDVAINNVVQTTSLPTIGPLCSTSNPVLNSINGLVTSPQNLSWSFPNLNPNDFITIKIRFRIKGTAPVNQIITNTVSLTGTATAAYSTDLCTGTVYPPIAVNASASDPFTIQAIAPRPVISKQVTNGTVFSPGDVVKFTVCISNCGGAPFTGNFSDFIDEHVNLNQPGK